MLLEERTIYEHAISRWGAELQTVKACEELAELIRALSRVTLAAKTAAPGIEYNAAWDNVLEELADVEIMLAQLRMIFDDKDVDRIRAGKLRRLAGILGMTEIKPPARPPMDAAEHPEDWSGQLGGED